MSPLSADIAAPSTPPGLLRNGNPRGNPNLAPRCGAKARTTGCACRAPAMANGRCRLHGGKSTGPRTAEGMARMAAAHTTHGLHGAVGAAERARRRHVKTTNDRVRILCTATRLENYLTPPIAAELAAGAPDLMALKHPSQVAFEASLNSTPSNSTPHNSTPRNSTRGGAGLGKTSGGSPGQASGDKGPGMGRTRRGGRGRVEPLMPDWRTAERATVQAEADLQAPWKAAIAFARVAKRQARAARAQAAAAKARGPRIDPVEPETAAAGVGPRGRAVAPARGMAVSRRPGPKAQAADVNPVFRELAMRMADLRARLGAGASVAAVGANPAPSEIDPMQRGLVARSRRLTPTMAMALRGTTAGKIWIVAALRAELGARFERAAPVGWCAPLAVPTGGTR
jgi:hypothetical protein